MSIENDNNQIESFSSFTWDIIDDSTAIKHCDKSFFEHHGTGIPMDTVEFWGVENLGKSQRKDITIIFEGRDYKGYFSVDPLERTRLFWTMELQKELAKYSSVKPDPVARFQKIAEDVILMQVLVGSEASRYERHTYWIVPCSPDVYDCGRAFNDLIRVDWKQSKFLNNVAVDDFVFIYSSTPIKAITYHCIVNKVNLAEKEISDIEYYVDKDKTEYDGAYIELQCLREFDALSGLRLEELRKHGVKGNLQSPMKASPELVKHLNEMLREQNDEDRFSGGNMKFVGASLERNESTEKDEITAPTLSDEALLQVAKRRGKDKATVRKVSSEQRDRDPYISEYAKRKANGYCQLCGQIAPFIGSNGKPYLETHHIIWLSKGGADSVENTVALCPNCHRKMHNLNDFKDIEILQEKVKYL